MDQLFTFLGNSPLVEKLTGDLSTGRLLESFILLWIIWRKLSPHLIKIENRLAGLEKAVTDGFNMGEQRFQTIEIRLTLLENKGQTNGSFSEADLSGG